MKMTTHALKRMQQRCIPPLIVDWLDAYGSTEKSNSSGEFVYFDRQARKDLEREFGKPLIKQLGRYMGVYLIRCDGKVITIAYRRKHLIRH